ncbi:Xylose isomerase-like TIM barrel [compost metagenome]
MVKEVGNPGFRLHLDAGALILNGENVSSSIEKAAAYMSHFHISEPFLNLVGNGDKSKHTEIAKALKSSGYAHWVSIEMKNDSTSASVDNVKKALAYALEVYH